MQLTSPGTNGNSAGAATDLHGDRPVVPVEKPALNLGLRSGPSRGRRSRPPRGARRYWWRGRALWLPVCWWAGPW